MTAATTNGQAITKLFPSHQIELIEGSGLTPETIQAAGIYSEGDYPKLAAILNRKTYSRKMGSALVFPYRDETGTVVLNRIKPTHPPKYGGKLAKYLSPSGGTVRVYFPLDVFPLLDDPKARLLITEGEKKALCATQNSFHCIGLSGVDCWHAKRSGTLLPDLDHIKWRHRPVFICFDSDAADNENVQTNERLLASALTHQGAKVRIVRLPGGDHGEKVGLDDFLVANGPAALHELVESAQDPEPPEAGEAMGLCQDADPAIEASHILAACKRGNACRLIFWRGSFHWWSKGCYREKPIDEVRGEVTNNLNRRWLGVRTRYVTDIVEQIKAKTLQPSSKESPAWIADKPDGFDPEDCLATQSEIVHLPTLADGRDGATMPATPHFLCTTATDYSLDLTAPKPQAWLDFLQSLWPDDQQSINAMQELFGYCLTSDTSQQKIFMLVGPKRSGKGTIARVLTALLGKDNIAAPTLAGLSTNFGLWPLIGKSVAIISDARLSGRTDQVAVVERLLSISGEDSTTIDRKNLQPITMKLPTRFVILTNELPKLNDASGAIVSRLILLHMQRSFYGYEDRGLTDKLLAERQGILLWAIEGWRRLRERGRFVQPDAGLEHLSDMADLASPISAFVRECCELGPGLTIPCSDLFDSWKLWCETQGRERYVGTVQSFGRDMLASTPGVRRRQLRVQGSPTRIYEGIGRPGSGF
jgi:putative DNA primase/helicase